MILGATGGNHGRIFGGPSRQSDRERLGLFVAGVTILLSQTVFSLLVAHVLTKSSEAVPLIG